MASQNHKVQLLCRRIQTKSALIQLCVFYLAIVFFVLNIGAQCYETVYKFYGQLKYYTLKSRQYCQHCL